MIEAVDRLAKQQRSTRAAVIRSMIQRGLPTFVTVTVTPAEPHPDRAVAVVAVEKAQEGANGKGKRR